MITLNKNAQKLLNDVDVPLQNNLKKDVVANDNDIIDF
jgi:hypothetical protein